MFYKSTILHLLVYLKNTWFSNLSYFFKKNHKGKKAHTSNVPNCDVFIVVHISNYALKTWQCAVSLESAQINLPLSG